MNKLDYLYGFENPEELLKSPLVKESIKKVSVLVENIFCFNSKDVDLINSIYESIILLVERHFGESLGKIYDPKIHNEYLIAFRKIISFFILFRQTLSIDKEINHDKLISIIIEKGILLKENLTCLDIENINNNIPLINREGKNILNIISEDLKNLVKFINISSNKNFFLGLEEGEYLDTIDKSLTIDNLYKLYDMETLKVFLNEFGIEITMINLEKIIEIWGEIWVKTTDTNSIINQEGVILKNSLGGRINDIINIKKISGNEMGLVTGELDLFSCNNFYQYLVNFSKNGEIVKNNKTGLFIILVDFSFLEYRNGKTYYPSIDSDLNFYYIDFEGNVLFEDTQKNEDYYQKVTNGLDFFNLLTFS